MLSKIREILLTQYIGAILVALLGCNAVVNFITTLLRTVAWGIKYQRTQSAMGASGIPFPWDDLIYSAVTILLYLLVAYLLARWIYPGGAAVPVDAGKGETAQPGDRAESS